jgi:peptide-methionine (S)-S-oxide reductase
MKKLTKLWVNFLACVIVISSFAGCTQTKPSTVPSVPVSKDDTAGDPVADRQDTVSTNSVKDTPMAESASDQKPKTETATFGAGCFWCVEAVFDQLKGVESVESGYTGGSIANPTYEQVCSGVSGHAEVIQITYDANVISYAKLLEVFWKTHDPTTLNQQGGDYGTQYRSAVFYHDEDQLKQASEYKQKLNDENVFGVPVVTTMEKLGKYYPAEEYHQDYFKLNGSNSYCRLVIPPKLDKLQRVFGDLLKDEK